MSDEWSRTRGEVIVWELPDKQEQAKKQKRVWLKSVVVMVASVGTGCLFGVLLISAVPESSSADRTDAGASTAATEASVPAPAASPAVYRETVYMLQSGVFSSRHAAEEAAAGLGEAAVLHINGSYSVAAGFFQTEVAAKQAEQEAEKTGKRMFVKPFEATVREADKQKWRDAIDSQLAKTAAALLVAENK